MSNTPLRKLRRGHAEVAYRASSIFDNRTLPLSLILADDALGLSRDRDQSQGFAVCFIPSPA